MLLFRGQNKNTKLEPNNDRPDLLGGRNGAVYFLDFIGRAQAFAYATQNFNVLLDEDSEEEEHLEEGYVYKCRYNNPNPVFLNDIPAFANDDITNCLVSIYDKLPRSLYPTLSTLFEDLENESVYDAIMLIENLSNEGKVDYSTYLSCVNEITDCVGTSIANIVYEDGTRSKHEFVVFNVPRDVTIDSIHKVKREDIAKANKTINVKDDLDVIKFNRGKNFDLLTR